jgi:hypothetical protein
MNNFAATCAADLGQALNSGEGDNEHGYDIKRTPKKHKASTSTEKSDGSAYIGPESSRTDKSRKKTVLEVVIMSPRKQKRKKVKVNKKGSSSEGKSSESRTRHPASSPMPAELPLKPAEDEDAQVPPQQTSDDEDELILAPKRASLSKAKLDKGKQRTREPLSVDDGAPPELEPSNDRVGLGEEGEEPGEDEHHVGGASTSRTNGGHRNKTRLGPETPAQVGPMAI